MTGRRTRRAAIVLWAVVTIVVWNGVYDVRMSLAIREYLLQQALHEAGRGPAIAMAEHMRDAVAHAVRMASILASIVAAAAVWSVRALGPPVPRFPSGRPSD
jgi:hypothetical protein